MHDAPEALQALPEASRQRVAEDGSLDSGSLVVRQGKRAQQSLRGQSVNSNSLSSLILF
jgi:hypothetical protein